ncbi:MAG TPA: SAM-dependent chlorinase/fluorinase [Candidatus Angelobacter sp.]|nr:SAM-dependent chlorinase/fluorinase [Candidatus Angelobacter sp.]
MATITLLSDFGLTDPYVAEMKGVILSANPHLNIIDVSHGIERHNVAMGSFILEAVSPHFPRGSIHVAVVDPGVGTERLSVVVDCERGILVGPDNGLLVRASERLGFKGAYQIDSRRFRIEKISSTFHGRDIFARTAASLAIGLKPDSVGGKLKQLVRLDIPTVSMVHGRANCTVLHVDSFGNVILNLTDEDIARLHIRSGDRVTIRTPRRRAPGLVAKTYSDIPQSRLAMIRGSQGYLEIAMRESSAAARLGLKPLDQVVIGFS